MMVRMVRLLPGVVLLAIVGLFGTSSQEEAGLANGRTCLILESGVEQCQVDTLTSADTGESPAVSVDEAAEKLILEKFNARMDERRHLVRRYLKKVVAVDKKYSNVRKQCRATDTEECIKWATEGECEKNAGYMKKECAAACLSCDFLETNLRCAVDPSAPSIWQAGDVNRLFEGLVKNESFADDLIIHTSPQTDGPWLVSIDNFLSPSECQQVIDVGTELGFEPSILPKIWFSGDGVSKRRTSSVVWCHSPCKEDPIVRKIQDRIADLTGIPRENSEALQLLRYEKTQHYAAHHDYITKHLKQPQGVRVLTVFLYLSEVEAGGGTRFADLQKLIVPRPGRIVIWPNVLDQDPHSQDPRLYHEATPVEEGVKYAINAWLHQRDFDTPFANSCVV